MRVKVDYSFDELLTPQALDLLPQYYMVAGETSPQDAFARAAEAYCAGDMALAQRIYDYAARGWFMFASPVLSNAPSADGKISGMPISCFLNYVEDTREGLVHHRSETAWLTFMGGGVGGHWSDIRAVSKKSNGPIPHIRVVDSQMLSDSQGKTRRGSYAAYLDVTSPDIMEFLDLRTPTGGDPNRKCFNVNIAVNVTDKFMEAVLNDDMWDLFCPHEGTVRESIKARTIWKKIIETRFKTGEPYINFIDTANAALPKALKDRGLKIRGSNLCNEIHLPTSAERTAVCCLSSLNLEKWEEWKDTKIVEDLVRFLDNVLQFFIDHAPKELDRAIYSAKRERSLGLGAMGFHSLLQQKMIAFESESARKLNTDIFRTLRARARKESHTLAIERGEAPDMECMVDLTLVDQHTQDSFKEQIRSSERVQFVDGGWKYAHELREGDIVRINGRVSGVYSAITPDDYIPLRNSHIFAIAPNANSSIIHGCSPSIEPWASNAITHRTRAGTHFIKNKYLDEIIVRFVDGVVARDYGEGTAENAAERYNYAESVYDKIWSEIVANEGSIQNMDIFSPSQKDVFKTSFELDQSWVVKHAADRQPYICQGQSVNVFFPYGSDAKMVSDVHILAWESGLKGLYYLRTEAGKKSDKIGKRIERTALGDIAKSQDDGGCVACQA